MDTATEAIAPEVPLEHLEHEICRLSAHLSAAMCRWLELVAEFDRRQGWGHQGAKSCAEWLSWKCGLSLVAGRQHLRVANRLPELSKVRAAFAAGELSYSKVRALVRIATPETEGALVELARYTTASQLDRIARARSSVQTGDDAEEAKRRHEARHLHWFWDDDGSLVLTARLGPDEGALVLQALDAAAHAHRAESGDDPAGSPERPRADDPAGSPGDLPNDPAGSPVHPAVFDDPAESPGPVPPPAEDTTAVARRRNAEATRIPASRADALVAIAESVLAHGPAARDGGERYQVVVTVPAGVLAGSDPYGVGEIDDGPALSSEAARRLACDSTVVGMSLGDGGEVLSVGRATPAIPRHIRRALRKRDGGCRFPGCGQRRFVDGHHIIHWARGGETSLANLCLLCRFHHHAVHEGDFGLVRVPDGRLVFTTPAGDELTGGPAAGRVMPDVDDVNRSLGVVIGSETGACLWGGERLDLGLTLDALLSLEGRIGA